MGSEQEQRDERLEEALLDLGYEAWDPRTEAIRSLFVEVQRRAYGQGVEDERVGWRKRIAELEQERDEAIQERNALYEHSVDPSKSVTIDELDSLAKHKEQRDGEEGRSPRQGREATET